MCAQGILVALLEREVSGEGQWVHTSLLQAQVFMLDFQGARWTMDGEVPQQAGNDHPTSIPTGVFITADGQINLAVAGEVTWRRFCTAVGLDDLPGHPDFATGEARSANRADLNARINAVLETDTSAAWIKRLNTAGVPCGEINTIDKTFADPQVRHLGLTESVETPYRGDTHFLAQPMRLSRTPSHVVVRPPERGEHTDEILRDLGLDDDAIADLKDRNVV
jgi:formyl-CoA transferase